MAFHLSTRPGSITTKVVDDPTVDATPQNNIMSGAGTVFSVTVNNSENTTQDVFFKLWNHVGPTVGTTNADLVFCIPAGTQKCFSIPEGIAFGTGISYACVTSSTTASTASPANDVTAILQVS
jgi:hypothetical protein